MGALEFQIGEERYIVQFEDGQTLSDLIKKKGMHPSGTIVLRGETPIPVSEVAKDGDVLKLFSVASGG